MPENEDRFAGTIAVIGAGAGLATSAELAASDLDQVIRDLTWKRDTLRKQAAKYRAAVAAREDALGNVHVTLLRPVEATERLDAMDGAL